AIRNSIGLIESITEEFTKLVDTSSGVARAQVYTAVDLNKEQQTSIEHSISKALNTELQVSYHKDTELLGGLVVRVNDLVIDGSIQEKLVGLRRQIGK
ncbi:MAG TPA: ATP synthase F1 subunit delta, partial [Chloroflexi bacterium]|nr:ATP synthase F1 subunit delta [Chloroflexota bacterium]